MAEEKTIRGSQRGLTFSFSEQGSLTVGQRYDYIIDKAAKRIRIVPAEDGQFKLSRKRIGKCFKPLVDLRNKEVLTLIAGMEKIRVSITDTEIIVSDACARKSQGKSGVVLRFPRWELAHLRAAAGMGTADAVSALISGVQMSLDDYLAENDILDVPRVAEDLADVYTVVSLFSGAGILDWPFYTDEHFRIQYAIDYDEAACNTYRRNIGMHIVQGDIHKAFTDDGYPLDATVTPPDVIIGGPSCKPFSNANRHTRLADHPDSDLLMQYMRIVENLHPKVFAMENVPEVLTACGGAYFNAIQEEADKCGYQVSAHIVDDNKVGGYTIRKRAVILGNRVGEATASLPVLETGQHTVRDALSKITPAWSNYYDVSRPTEQTKQCMSYVPQGGNWTSIPKELLGNSHDRHSNSFKRLAWDKPAPTIVNWRKTSMTHPTENRTLTVAEAKALQGLPGDFHICGTLNQMQQQVGNSVPVAIGRFIKNAVLAMLNAASGKMCLQS